MPNVCSLLFFKQTLIKVLWLLLLCLLRSCILFSDAYTQIDAQKISSKLNSHLP